MPFGKKKKIIKELRQKKTLFRFSFFVRFDLKNYEEISENKKNSSTLNPTKWKHTKISSLKKYLFLSQQETKKKFRLSNFLFCKNKTTDLRSIYRMKKLGKRETKKIYRLAYFMYGKIKTWQLLNAAEKNSQPRNWQMLLFFKFSVPGINYN